ncbi:MAG: cyclopropane-fatty-acyl-phospholipid synthase family protein [Desulfuromonadaceae bacterium]|nr:cyclopropane-fatty-acyl-phospholipid synthase family protein [Desulfuromonadaceae bacterium]
MKNIFKEIIEATDPHKSGAALQVHFWDGDNIRIGQQPAQAKLEFRSPTALRRVLQEGSLGFGEEYMLGNIEIEGDMQHLIRVGLNSSLDTPQLPLQTKMAVALLRLQTNNTKSRAAINIQRHYDLGNDFYRLWLDSSMTYSCAYFRNDRRNLEQAQSDKYEHICRKLRLKQGESLVDIGCGWGGMLIYAAKHYGISGVGCTLSQQQYEYACARIKEENLTGQINIRLEDYRDLRGQFDKFVSIGMFEHVGKKYHTTFMQKVRGLLKPGGFGVLHCITKDAPEKCDPWINKYIFPGGEIPAVNEVVRLLGNGAFILEDMENLRRHYAITLCEWTKRYEQVAATIEATFGPHFARMWRTYLNFSEAAFCCGKLHLHQFLFSCGTDHSYPLTREHVYGSDAGHV